MTALAALADRVSAGGSVTDDDARLLLESHDLIAIGMMGDDMRRRRHGSRTTFVRVFEVHADAVPGSLPAGVSAGELRLIGRPPSIDAACGTVQAARALARATPLTGFSPGDLLAWGGAPREVCAALREAGLDALAEVAVDAAEGSEQAIEAARAAGLRVERLTVHHGGEDRLALVARARELQRSAGGFKAFAPLPRGVPATGPTTGYDDVKLIALARLFAVEIPSIQVDWALYGPKLAQVALTVGADDVDGVAAADPGTLGPRRSAIEEIKGNIRAAGLEPVERNGLFDTSA